MSRRNGAEKVLIANATITTGSGILDTIIAAQSGMIIGINQLIATNQINGLTALTFYDETSPISPSMVLGASGTLILDDFGGPNLELTRSSGLFGSSTLAGNTQVTVYYVLYDETDPITKMAARAASFTLNTTATRTPNRAGSQGEG